MGSMRRLAALWVCTVSLIGGLVWWMGTPVAEPASGVAAVRPPARPALVSPNIIFPGKPVLSPLGPVAVCFEEGTPPDVMARYYDAMQHGPEDQRFFIGGSWASQGTPRTLTWSFVPDGLSIPPAIQGEPTEASSLFSRMDSLFAGLGGRAAWIAQFEACFARWAALSGMAYTRITFGGNDWDDGAAWGANGSSSRGDVRICMKLINGAGGVLAYNFFPTNSDMVLDRAESWSSTNNSFRFLRNIVMHEHGHGLGFAHVCPANGTKLMEPFLSTSFDGPQHDDIRAVQYNYGDAFESDNSPGAAPNVGTVNVGTPLTVGPIPAPAVAFSSLLSIDNNGKQDYLAFTVTGPRALAVTLTPLGLNYDSSSQNGDGSCNSGNFINSLTIANLAMQVIATNGSTVLATADAQPAGVAETLSNVHLLTAGTYYLRVFESNTPNQPQLYQATLSVTDLDCNGNTIPDPLDISGGTSQDCNANQLPDECEITQFDCNANSVPDDCDIALGTSQDCSGDGIPNECEPNCNANGVPDPCDIAGGTSLDCNTNVVPDECELVNNDCNANLRPDDCDIAVGTSIDCDDNLVPDECQDDCNNNLIADPCEFNPIFTSASGPLSPINSASPQTYTISAAPQAFGNVSLAFSASGDFSATNEYVSVDINGVPVGIVFQVSGTDCANPDNVDELVISAAAYNAAVNGGDAVIHMVPTSAVDPPPISCAVSHIQVTVTHPLEPGDCDGNEVLDSCELAANDCNNNGKIDACDISNGVELDCNENGVPDSCDIAGATSEDCDSSNVPDECEADCNNNGLADSCDIASGTADDCNLNAIPDSCDILGGTAVDADMNNVIDECETPEFVVYLVSPQAEPGTGQTVAEAQAWGQAPVLPNPGCGQPLNATVEVWLKVNNVGPRFQQDGYTTLFSGGFDVAGENDSVKASDITIYSAFDPPPTRWDAESLNGGVGGADYLWQGTIFYAVTGTGISSQAGAMPPQSADVPPNNWKIATMTLSIADAGSINGMTDSFFDVFFELRGVTWFASPDFFTSVAYLAWGLDDQDESFLADLSLREGRRSTHPELRIRTCNIVVPQCGTCRGDVDGDNAVDGDDIDNFVACYFGGDPLAGGCGCADVSADGAYSALDVQQFVSKLLGIGDPNTACP